MVGVAPPVRGRARSCFMGKISAFSTRSVETSEKMVIFSKRGCAPHPAPRRSSSQTHPGRSLYLSPVTVHPGAHPETLPQRPKMCRLYPYELYGALGGRGAADMRARARTHPPPLAGAPPKPNYVIVHACDVICATDAMHLSISARAADLTLHRLQCSVDLYCTPADVLADDLSDSMPPSHHGELAGGNAQPQRHCLRSYSISVYLHLIFQGVAAIICRGLIYSSRTRWFRLYVAVSTNAKHHGRIQRSLFAFLCNGSLLASLELPPYVAIRWLQLCRGHQVSPRLDEITQLKARQSSAVERLDVGGLSLEHTRAQLRRCLWLAHLQSALSLIEHQRRQQVRLARLPRLARIVNAAGIL